jgi:2-polyprenyl-3-methyl-5-hydroxy-6-metoxy-1,4-benzoquinol methylase
MINGIRWRLARWKAGSHVPIPVWLEPTGDRFRQSVLDHYGVSAVEQLDATRRMWADFTLSSPQRGSEAVAMMGGAQAFLGKRVLDVGCAQGGFVVAAAKAGAAEVVGIDNNPVVFETAPLLLSDYGVEADLRRADLTEESLPSELGRFDLILCNDVLEHVTDVEKAVANLEQLMTPGARLYLEIPNGTAVHYVRSDGHYKIPGITLLDFEDARRWHGAFFPEAGPYDTYFYGTLDFYLAAFSQRGIALQLLHVPTGDDVSKLRSEFDSLVQEFAGFRQRHSEKPPELVDKIVSRATDYQARLRAQLERLETLDNPLERTLMATSLRCTYEIGNWVLIGHRP